AFSYDVVSIKPFKMEPGVRIESGSTPDGLSDRGVGLVSLLMNAFPILTLDQLVGVPDWAVASRMNDDRYDVEAKMDEETATALKKLSWDQQQEIRRSMMLQVITDRCKLKYHKETREMPIYNLVIAKGGPKFKETPAGKTDGPMMGWGEISGDGISFDQGVLMNLSSEAKRFVVNKTGLTGKYTLSLKWNPYADQDVPAWFLDQYGSQFKGRPGIFDALEEQLGLKLESAKGPVDVYVIDHVEKPSPD
ncbi:MAG: TIGR03435 family protein, partial [Terracidiphilus sp.]